MTINSVTVVISSYVLPLMTLWLKVVEMDGGRVVSEWGGGGFVTWSMQSMSVVEGGKDGRRACGVGVGRWVRDVDADCDSYQCRR